MSDLPSQNFGVNSGVSNDSASGASDAQGVMLAVGATCIWGMFPLIFKTVAHMAPLEVLAHRSLWSLVFAALLMAGMGRWEIFQRAFYAPHLLGVAMLSGLAVAVNWGTFIWAVSNDQVLQSSLGYYISPLVSVLLGVVLLRERLGFWGWLAIGLAAAGVLLLVVRFAQVPWVALSLALSWALYGLVRKRARVGSLPGLYLETLMLSPIALGYVVWLGTAVPVFGVIPGAVAFGANLADSTRLIITGAVTALPLLLFARATRILRLSTIGVLMYIVPTGQFLLAVFVFDEPFTQAHLWAFALIWLGLGIYGWHTLRRAGNERRST